MADGFRTEKDPLGTLQVPESALYGVQTLRAVHPRHQDSFRDKPRDQ